MAILVLSSSNAEKWSPVTCCCLSCQVGHDKQGLPIGLQLMGRPWGEASLLRVASAVEVLYMLIILLFLVVVSATNLVI